jgi:hypothetical protein
MSAMKLKTAQQVFDRLNRDTFSGLINTRLWISRSTRFYGHYNRDGIGLSRVNIRNHTTLCETIYHEIIHVYIDDILEVKDTGEHGLVFWQWYDYLLPNWITPDYIGTDYV